MMIPEYIRFLERNQASEKTIKCYQNKVRIFVTWLDKKLVGIPEVSPDHIFDFHQHLMIDRKNKPSTRAAYLGALRNYFEFMITTGMFKENPAKAVAKPKVVSTPPNSLSEEEIEKLMIAAFERKTELGMRDMAMISVLAGTGCRVSALTGMRLTDFRPTEVIVPESCQHCGQPILNGRLAGRGKKKKVTMARIREKAGREWDIIMPDKSAMYLGHYLQSRKIGANTDIVFPIKERITARIKPASRHVVLNAIKALAIKADIKRSISPHCFRHAFITYQLDMGVDPEVVQRWVGHRALTQTMEYRNKSIRSYVWSGVGAEKNLFENVKTPLDHVYQKIQK